MQVAVTFRHIDGTKALQEYAEKRVQHLRKFLKKPIDAHVVLEVLKHRHLAEVTLGADRHVFNAREETGDLYSAIDLAVSKLERQIKKDAGKRQSRKHIRVPEPVNEVAPDRRRAGRIETERILVKPMSVRDAVAEIRAGKDDFLLFHNAATETLNVLRRRKNGQVVLIEPEVG